MSEVKIWWPMGRMVQTPAKSLGEPYILQEDYAALEAKAKAWERLARASNRIRNMAGSYRWEFEEAGAELSQAESALSALGVEL